MAEDATTIIEKSNVSTIGNSGAAPLGPDSQIFKVSIRAWLAVFLVLTLCGNHLIITAAVMFEAVKRGDFAKVGTYTTITEPLYSIAIAVVAYYFGQKTASLK